MKQNQYIGKAASEIHKIMQLPKLWGILETKAELPKGLPFMVFSH